MFKSLILGAVCLISHACTFNSVSVNNDYCNNSNDSYVSRVNEVKAPLVERSFKDNYVYGLYNFNDTFDFSYDGEIDINVDFLVFDTTTTAKTTPMFYEENDGIYFLQRFYLEFMYDGTDVFCDVATYYYDSEGLPLSFTFSISNHTNVTQINTYGGEGSIRHMHFFVQNGFSLSDDYNGVDLGLIWNFIFTHEDNRYVTSYTGYYSFNNNLSSIPHQINCLGSLTFDNKIFIAMSGVSSTLYFYYFDTYDVQYALTSYSLPFNGNTVVSSNLFLNCKMDVKTYQDMSEVGIFAYVRDSSYDNTDFHDLLFSIADTPLYFITRLLDWQLFGMNLFIAFAGLLTVAIVLVCIRRFF